MHAVNPTQLALPRTCGMTSEVWVQKVQDMMLATVQGRWITQRYYSEPKKREISRVFLWTKVFLDKGITNRTIGRAGLTFLICGHETIEIKSTNRNHRRLR